MNEFFYVHQARLLYLWLSPEVHHKGECEWPTFWNETQPPVDNIHVVCRCLFCFFFKHANNTCTSSMLSTRVQAQLKFYEHQQRWHRKHKIAWALQKFPTERWQFTKLVVWATKKQSFSFKLNQNDALQKRIVALIVRESYSAWRRQLHNENSCEIVPKCRTVTDLFAHVSTCPKTKRRVKD